jgi:arsenate reductase (thioredoxin)
MTVPRNTTRSVARAVAAFAGVAIVSLAACKSPEAPTPEPQKADEAAHPKQKVAMNDELSAYIRGLLPSVSEIPEERRPSLDELAVFIKSKRSRGESAKLTFICTHNSRRSHLSQIWASAAAAYYGVDGVETYSGGTERTAFNPRAVAAIERAGFQVERPDESENPHYAVTFASAAEAMECYSKKYDDEGNPKSGFAAIMTCGHADRSCPLVRGSALRVALPYEDPKAADGSEREAEVYDERTRQIATEMLYVFSKVAAS